MTDVVAVGVLAKGRFDVCILNRIMADFDCRFDGKALSVNEIVAAEGGAGKLVLLPYELRRVRIETLGRGTVTFAV